MPRVYIATSYLSGAFVEAVVVAKLHRRGLEPCSSWHAGMSEPAIEDLAALTVEQRRAIAEQNDRDISRADGMLVIAQPKARETWCEARTGQLIGIPVAVVRGGQSLPLSAYRDGVEVVETIAEGVERIAELIEERAEAIAARRAVASVW